MGHMIQTFFSPVSAGEERERVILGCQSTSVSGDGTWSFEDTPRD